MSASILRFDSGPRADQIVEVIAWADERNLSYGSGYQLSDNIIITARHVVRHARAIEVRFVGPASQGTVVQAQEVWSGATELADIALLRINRPSPTGSDWKVAAPALGYLPRQLQQRLPFVAAGFPRLKSRLPISTHPAASDSPNVLRDSEVIYGYVPSLSNLKTGFMDLIQEEKPVTSPSEWAGMSGAAVFVHGLLVGVVSQMQRGYRLSAASLPYTDGISSPGEDPEKKTARELFETILASQGIAARPVPAGPRSAYSARLDAAVPHDFSGRNDELQKLNQLVHSDKGYAWWYADPWAGKTALAAMFSSRPPDDVDVVAYLVSRAHGEDQTYRFLHWVCDQLAALLAAKSPAQPDYTQFLSLWADACDRASLLGRHLALVIDGLDENTGDPKIASFLPAELAPSSHIVIFSRPHPGVPAEVPDGHPLRNPDTWHRLAPSSAAVAAGRQAERELGSLLREPDARTIIGLLSAGGPLSTTEIADLSRVAFSSSELRIQLRRFDVQRVVTEKAARVLKPVTDDADRYAFAHDLLREKAEAILADEVEEHRRRITAWADTYASADWPDTTPGYLAERGIYAQWLVRIKDVGRLIELPTPRRARLLRERTGDDFLCQAELSSALDAMMSDCAANLPRACVLSYRRQLMRKKVASYPPALAEGWAKLGKWARAKFIADQLTDQKTKISALGTMADLAVQAGNLEEAASIAMKLCQEGLSQVSPGRAEAIAETAVIACSLAHHGDFDSAAALVESSHTVMREIPLEPGARRAAVELTRAFIALGWHDRAREYVKSLVLQEPRSSSWAMEGARDRSLAMRVAGRSGLLGPAREVALSLQGDADRALALADADIEAMASASPDRAAPLLEGAVASVMAVEDAGDRTERLRQLAIVASGKDLYDWIFRLPEEASPIRDEAVRSAMLCAAEAGHYETARRLSALLPGLRLVDAQRITAEAAARRGEYDSAERMCRDIDDFAQRVRALSTIAANAAEAGQARRAARIYTEIAFARPGLYPDLLMTQAVWQAAARRRYDEAQRAALRLTNDLDRINTMVSLAKAVASSGEDGEILDVLRQLADSVSRIEEDPLGKREELAEVLADAGMLQESFACIRQIDGTSRVVDALRRITAQVAGRGRTGTAIEMCRLASGTDKAMTLSLVALEGHNWLAASEVRGLLEEAEAAAEAGSGASLEDECAEWILAARAYRGDTGGVTLASRLIKSPSRKVTALVRGAEILPAEHPEPRLAILNDAANACFEIKTASDRGASLIEVARGLLHAGPAARAAELLEESVRALQSSNDEFLTIVYFRVMMGVIQDMAGMGESAGVLRIAGAAPFAEDDFFLLEAASEALRGGHLESTLAIFRLISPNFALNDPGALKVLATAAFLQGRDELFNQSRARITNPRVTAELLIEVGRAAAKRNNHDAAKRFLKEAFVLRREISDVYEQEEIISAISAAASDCGFYDLALRAIKLMRSRFLRSNGLSTIARNYLRAGRAQAAENVISALSILNESIIYAKERTRVYLELADLLSTVGRGPRPALERAWRAALSIDNEIDLFLPLTIAPDERLSIFNDSRRKVEVLADVARSAHGSGEIELLSQVIDDCCKAAREENDPFDRVKGLTVALGIAVNAGFAVQAEACARDILAVSEGRDQDFTLAYVEDAADIMVSAMPDVAIRLISRALVTSFSPRLSFIASKLDARVLEILLGDVTI